MIGVFPVITGYSLPGPGVWLWAPFHSPASIAAAANDERGRFIYAVD